MTTATWNGATIAESDKTVVVEGNHYFPPGSGGVRTSRHQSIDRGRHNHRPSGTSPARRETSQNLARYDQAVFACPQSNDVPSTQTQWRITAIFRAMATMPGGCVMVFSLSNVEPKRA